MPNTPLSANDSAHDPRVRREARDHRRRCRAERATATSSSVARPSRFSTRSTTNDPTRLPIASARHQHAEPELVEAHRPGRHRVQHEDRERGREREVHHADHHRERPQQPVGEQVVEALADVARSTLGRGPGAAAALNVPVSSVSATAREGERERPTRRTRARSTPRRGSRRAAGRRTGSSSARPRTAGRSPSRAGPARRSLGMIDCAAVSNSVSPMPSSERRDVEHRQPVRRR